MDNLNEKFYLCMVIIGVGSFIFGILPAAFSFRGTRSSPFFLSLVLCLGAGVLLATSLVHMLTDVQEKIKFYAQLYYCSGFLALYVFDEISHYCLGSKKPQVCVSVHECDGSSNKRNDYGSAHGSCGSSENSPLLESNSQRNFEKFPTGEPRSSQQNSHSNSSKSTEREGEPQQSILDAYLNSDNEKQNEIVQCLDGEESWSHTSAAKTGLLIALLIHSILEGISIGVQTKTSQIFLILGAVTFHKIFLSFCLGLELIASKTSNFFAAIFIFSIGSPIGIFLGMTVTSFEKGVFGIDAELQAVAAGSLLYVATFEVLPRERLKWQHNNYKKGAGIFQLTFVLIGFLCITAFHILLSSADDSGGKIHPNATGKVS